MNAEGRNLTTSSKGSRSREGDALLRSKGKTLSREGSVFIPGGKCWLGIRMGEVKLLGGACKGRKKLLRAQSFDTLVRESTKNMSSGGSSEKFGFGKD